MPDPLPFDEVYRRYGERIYHYCLSLAHNRELAEDIAAETFVAAYAAYPKRQPDPEAVAPWLFVIARNLLIDHRRKEKRWDKFAQVLGRKPAVAESIEQIAETNRELAGVLSVLAKMNKRDRQLLALRVVGELTSRETAEFLGMSESAAAAATRRALERFRRISGEQK